MAKQPAVFVDRDDTLMVDKVYCRDPKEVELLPGAAEGLRLLAANGFSIVVVTNQSGVGRGYVDKEALESVNNRLRSELRGCGVDIHALYYCPHRPEDACDCRKPRPGLLLRAAEDLDLDLEKSFMVGDRPWDIEAGRAAGTRTVLIARDLRREDRLVQPDFIARDLVEAARAIIDPANAERGANGRES